MFRVVSEIFVFNVWLYVNDCNQIEFIKISNVVVDIKICNFVF